ncbi:hypothetical protein C8Q74DRAFT_528482 [Fomes fomentarius]|nr:hypothetical protein C8Q74DRAFT_528482 [Fomes fomentarius]
MRWGRRSPGSTLPFVLVPVSTPTPALASLLRSGGSHPSGSLAAAGFFLSCEHIGRQHSLLTTSPVCAPAPNVPIFHASHTPNAQFRNHAKLEICRASVAPPKEALPLGLLGGGGLELGSPRPPFDHSTFPPRALPPAHPWPERAHVPTCGCVCKHQPYTARILGGLLRLLLSFLSRPPPGGSSLARAAWPNQQQLHSPHFSAVVVELSLMIQRVSRLQLHTIYSMLKTARAWPTYSWKQSPPPRARGLPTSRFQPPHPSRGDAPRAVWCPFIFTPFSLDGSAANHDRPVLVLAHTRRSEDGAALGRAPHGIAPRRPRAFALRGRTAFSTELVVAIGPSDSTTNSMYVPRYPNFISAPGKRASGRAVQPNVIYYLHYASRPANLTAQLPRTGGSL